MILIEKMAASEGVIRGKDLQADKKIKSNNVEKLDLLTFFRKKYGWYFQKKKEELLLNATKNDMIQHIIAIDKIKSRQGG